MEHLQSISKDIFLKNTFEYLKTHDFGTVEIKELIEEFSVDEDIVLEWFENERDIFIGAYEYGYVYVTRVLFDFAYDRMCNLKGFFDEVVEEIIKNKQELRAVSYAAVSVEYGIDMKKIASKFKSMYDLGASRLAEVIGCKKDDILPIVHMFISVIHDYVVWDDYDILQRQLEYIYAFMSRQLGYNFG